MAEKIIRRRGDSNQRKQAHNNLAEIGALRAEYAAWKSKVKELEDALEHERAKQARANENYLKVQDQLSTVEEEIDCDPLPEGAQPKSRIKKRDHLSLQSQQLEAALMAQKKCTQSALDAVHEAERKLFVSDRNLNQLVDNLQDTEAVISVQAALDKERAERLAKFEVKRAHRWEKEQVTSVAARATQVQDLTNLASKQVYTAKTAHKKMATQIKEQNDNTKAVAAQLKETEDSHQDHRAEVVLELRSNIGKVRAELATQSERQMKIIADAKQRLEDEKESMLSKGMNPYVEFRKQEFDEEAAVREKKMRSTVEMNKIELAERMVREEERQRRVDAAAREAYEYEKKYRDSQGRKGVEEKTRDYIKSVTVGGKEILDPTGKIARIDPSQVTEVSDFSFGLGKSARISQSTMERITEKIRQGLRVDRDDLGEYQRLVNGLLPPEEKELITANAAAKKGKTAKGESGTAGGSRTHSAPGMASGSASAPGGNRVTFSSDDAEESEAARTAQKQALAAQRAKEKKVAELQTLANATGSMPGLSKAAVAVNIADDTEKKELLKLAEEEAGGSLKGSLGPDDAKSPKYKTVQLSKFEQDSLVRAKDRQKSRIEDGQVQVAGGRVFAGQSFVPKPAEILFKDFSVGKKYKKVFTLTNASYTFNSFKVLPLSDDVIDFFVVTYERPGRMSAGVSCSIEVAFMPQINKDIFGSIKFLTETGPFEVPLTCLIKRCAPRVNDIEIDFGQVVIGQISTQQMKISNSQALPTSFSVSRLEPSLPGSRRVSVAWDDTAAGGGIIEGDVEVKGTDDNAVVVDGTTMAGMGVGVGAGEAKRPTTGASTYSRVGTAHTRVGTAAAADVGDSEADADAGAEMGVEPALSETELQARVKRTLTEVFRKKQRENPYPLSFHIPDGFVEGYNHTSMEVTCAPLSVGDVIQKFSVFFSGVKSSAETANDLCELVTKEQIVTVRVKAVELPVFVEDDVVDLKCTLFGRVYRKRLEIRNRGTVSYRVNISIPPPYNSYIEVNPPMMFVQAKGAQAINIKFAPTVDLLHRLVHYTMPFEQYQDAALVNIPIKMQVVNQELPVFFILRSTVCPSTLELSTTSLDFGMIYLNQRSSLQLTVKNISMQPQKVAFVKLRKEVTVAPNDGFAALLPNETITFEISFCPLSAIDYSFDLILQSSLNDSYVTKIVAQGIESPLVFSATTVLLRTTGPGERVVQSVTVQNKSKKKQCFEVVSPDTRFTWLKISPAIIELTPGQGGRIEFEYLPPADAESLDPVAWREQAAAAVTANTTKKGAAASDPFEEWTADAGWVFGRGMFGEVQWVKAGAGLTKAGEDDTTKAAVEQVDASAAEERDADATAAAAAGKPPAFEDVPQGEWGVLGKWRFPVFIKPRGRAGAAASPSRPGSPSKSLTLGETASIPSNSPPPLFFNVETVVTRPQLTADIKVIDFGQVAIGTRQIRIFKVTNLSYEPISLRSDGINAVGAFTLITPLSKPILPGTTKPLIVECVPLRPGLGVEVLELSQVGTGGGGHSLRITLRAEGMQPTIELSGLSKPPNGWASRSGIVDFGNVVACDVVVQKFTVTNKSLFPVELIVNRVVGMGLSQFNQAPLIERTAAGLPLVTFRPERAVVDPGKGQEIEVVFRPDRGRLMPFREDLAVRVGTTDEIIAVGVFARIWPRQIYLATSNPVEEPFVKNQRVNPSAYVEDLLMSNSAYEVRSLAVETAKGLCVQPPPPPPITLEFPDPYADNVDPSTYVESDGGMPAGAKPAKGAPAPVATIKGRKQTKRISIGGAKITDGRPGSGNGTFEVVLGPVARDSGMWAASIDKGVVAVGAEVPVDFTCTLPKPKGIGGLSVGSWREYAAEVIIKGGWVAHGDPDESKIPIVLKAFVSF